jgi:N-acetylglutamate synthase-like GNAT family acetyltransferase
LVPASQKSITRIDLRRCIYTVLANPTHANQGIGATLVPASQKSMTRVDLKRCIYTVVANPTHANQGIGATLVPASQKSMTRENLKRTHCLTRMEGQGQYVGCTGLRKSAGKAALPVGISRY